MIFTTCRRSKNGRERPSGAKQHSSWDPRGAEVGKIWTPESMELHQKNTGLSGFFMFSSKKTIEDIDSPWKSTIFLGFSYGFAMVLLVYKSNDLWFLLVLYPSIRGSKNLTFLTKVVPVST